MTQILEDALAVGSRGVKYPAAWVELKPPAIRLVVAVFPDDDEYSAIALNLPGICGTGATLDEALADFKDAAAGVLAAYRNEAKEIPWCSETDAIPSGAVRKVVLIDG